MKEIKRYIINSYEGYWEEPDEEGQWVKFKDYENRIKSERDHADRLAAELASVKAELVTLMSFCVDREYIDPDTDGYNDYMEIQATSEAALTAHQDRRKQ